MNDDPANEDKNGTTRIEEFLSRRDPVSARRRAQCNKSLSRGKSVESCKEIHPCRLDGVGWAGCYAKEKDLMFESVEVRSVCGMNREG